jgi:hypothetical protein
MYGIIPNAKIDAFEKAPPENMFNRAIKPVSVCFSNWANALGSIPGSTTNEPKRYTAARAKVHKIRDLRSSTLQMFFMVSINFFILFTV